MEWYVHLQSRNAVIHFDDKFKNVSCAQHTYYAIEDIMKFGENR